MYVINPKTCIVNKWANSAINRQRLASGKYGVIEYTGETEMAAGVLYAKGQAPQKPLNEAKAEKLAEINAACDRILSDAVSAYPETEILTFDRQTAEAKAYRTSGKAEEAPLLSALAQGRGIGLDDLAERVIAKHQAFSLLFGTVIGQRQALEDRLDACTSVEDVRSLAVEIVVPC